MVRFEKLRERNWLEPLGKSLEYLHHLLMSVALVEEKWFSQLTRQHNLGNIAIWTFEWSLFTINRILPVFQKPQSGFLEEKSFC